MVDRNNEPKSISRVVGLPGETIYLKDAQVYIDDKELDSFYGRGLDNVYNRPLFEDAKEYDTKNSLFLRIMFSYWGMPGGEALIAEISERSRLKI